MSGNTEIIREQIAGERGRKVTPSDAFKAKLAELLAGAQEQAEENAEGIVLKAGFLSEEKEDLNARTRMQRIRAEQKAQGWKGVTLMLDPTQVAIIKARGGRSKLATSLESIIDRLVVSPGSAMEEDEPEENHHAAEEPDISERLVGSVVELWIMADGSVDGRVRQGAAGGWPRLSSLSFGQLICLWHLSQVSSNQEDPAMVEAFLDRRHPDWRTTGTPEAQMKAAAAEPYEVLGIPATSSFEEAKAAYKRAAHAAHPDKGGSPWLFRAIADAWASIKAAEEARIRSREKAAEEEGE